MYRPDYYTNTVEDAARYAADHADPVDVDYDVEPGCTCYQGFDPQQDNGPCPWCEHLDAVEDLYGPIPTEDPR